MFLKNNFNKEDLLMKSSDLILSGLSFKLKFNNFPENENLKLECNRSFHEILGYKYVNILNKRNESVITIMEKVQSR